MASIGVVKESATGEHRVAMVPAVVPRLRDRRPDGVVENAAGAEAFLPDSAYTEAGATPTAGAEVDATADVLLCVQPPAPDRLDRLRPGQLLVGLLDPLGRPEVVASCAR